MEKNGKMICWFIAGGLERSIAKADVERHRRRRVSALVAPGTRQAGRRCFNNRAGSGSGRGSARLIKNKYQEKKSVYAHTHTHTRVGCFHSLSVRVC